MSKGLLASDERSHVAIGALDQAASTRGQVEHHLGLAEAESVEVDHVDVGTLAGNELTAVVQAEDRCRPRGLESDGSFERELRTAMAVAVTKSGTRTQ